MAHKAHVTRAHADTPHIHPHPDDTAPACACVGACECVMRVCVFACKFSEFFCLSSDSFRSLVLFEWLVCFCVPLDPFRGVSACECVCQVCFDRYHLLV